VYNKAIRILGMINRTIRYKERRIMVRLYKSLVKPHLEYCVSASSPHYLNCFFGAASIDEPQGFSGSPPVVFIITENV